MRERPAQRLAATERARLENLTFISAYNDPFVIAGGGTVALEILEDNPQIDLIIVGVGGGGVVACPQAASSAIMLSNSRNLSLGFMGRCPGNKRGATGCRPSDGSD